MSRCVWHPAALALLLVLLGPQGTLPHAHTAAASGGAGVEADARHQAISVADHAAECLLCRLNARTRAASLPPAVAKGPVPKPRIAVIQAVLHAPRGPALRAGAAPRAPPFVSPLV